MSLPLPKHISQRLGIIQPNGKALPLRGSIETCDPDKLCFLVFGPKTGQEGKEKIVDHYPVREIISNLLRQVRNPSEHGVLEKYRKRQKLISYAKTKTMGLYEGLSYEDMNLCVTIARTYYKDTHRYLSKRKLNMKKTNVLIDSSMMPYLVPHFSGFNNRTFNIQEMEGQSSRDKLRRMLNAHGLLITEDRGYLDLIEAVYTDRVRETQNPFVSMSEWPLIVYMEKHDVKKQTDDDYIDYADMTRSERREMKSMARRVSADFRKHAFNNRQGTKFKGHLRQILHWLGNPERPVLAVSILRDGRIEFHNRHEYIHDNFRIVDHENDAHPEALSAEAIKGIRITHKGRDRDFRGRVAGGKSPHAVFAQAGIDRGVREEIVAGTLPLTPVTRKNSDTRGRMPVRRRG